MKKKKTVCYFGTFPMSQAYSRNLIIKKCLFASGWEIIECRIETKMTATSRILAFKSSSAFLQSILTIFSQWYTLFKEHSKISDYDLMIVGYPSHLDVFLGFLLSKIKRRPLIMDAFIGLHDTVVKDRRLISESNPLSHLLWLFEWAALHLPDKVMVDTQTHKEMLIKSFHLKPDRVFVIPVGIDENIWEPQPLPPGGKCFHVAVWSTFIPLHGMRTIAEAADILNKQNYSIKIHVMGDGQTADQFAKLIYEKKLYNIEWKRGFFDIEEIVNLSSNSNCCLGIFGTTEKTNRVIPYKVYQALAMARPVITADTYEMRQIFSDTPGGLLVSPGDAAQLAEAIRKLSKNNEMCQQLVKNARIIYERSLSNLIIQHMLEQEINFH